MKRTLLSFLCVALISSWGFGQSFSDDFESYTAGDYLAASNSEWTTWGGSTGTAEDVQISDEQAASGTNSIKFASTAANGGPQDVVKYFGGQKLTTGQLNTRMQMLVETGAYFNYQAETTIGTTWAMNAFFEANGKGRITGSTNADVLTFDYPMGEWFDFKMAINFDANKWQLEVNGVCVGSFENNNNSIASIDIYPVQGNSFFVDDFGYDYLEVSPEIKDDAIAILKAADLSNLAGNTVSLEGTFSNGGSTVIESFELEASVNNNTIPVSMEGLNLAMGESMDFVIDEAYVLEGGISELVLDIKSVNGGDFVDEDECNNSSRVALVGVVAADHKKIIAEEGTGTWCGWCPRGTVAMERLSVKYPERFIGIAIHNGDPMVNTEYDGAYPAGGYPTAIVNRGDFINPAEMEGPFIQRVQEASAAIVKQGANWNPDTRELSISMRVTPMMNLSSDFKVNIALTEDDVTGTSNAYAQENYYSSQSQNLDLIDIHGVNWKDLPATISASDIDYDHVARAILAPYLGMEDSFGDGLENGDYKIFNFTYTIPAGFNEDKMHIVSMIINPDGTINTGESNTIVEAIENGFEELTNTHDIELTNKTSVYPNPFTDQTNVSVNLSEKVDVTLTVVDMSGKTMMQKTYNNQNGLFNIQLDGSSLPAGVYVLKILAGDKYSTKKISVTK